MEGETKMTTAHEMAECANMEESKSPLCWDGCERVLKGPASEQTRRLCSSLNCQRSVHTECLKDLFTSLKLPSGFNRVVCSRRCYKASLKPLSVQVKMASYTPTWYNDGPSPGVCSLGVLLEWLETGDNYKRYASSTGPRKEEIAREVGCLFATRGITQTRTPEDILKQIGRLEHQFQVTTKWLEEKDQQDTLESSMEAARFLCPKYDRLKVFMEPVTRLKPPQPKKQRKCRAPQQQTSQEISKPRVNMGKRAPPKQFGTRRAEARIEDALSRAAKYRQEAHFLRLKTTSMALYERIQLRKEGVPQAEIDLLIPPYRSE